MTPASPPGGPSAVNPAGARPETRPTPIPPSVARGTDTAQPSTPSTVQLTFQTPGGALVGEAFDVRVAIISSQPVARVGVEVNYDPTLLKARTLDEIDYATRAPGELAAFKIDEPSDGRATLVLVLKGGQVPRMNVPLVQFEALSPGWAQIRIDSISVTDVSDRPLPWAASGQESRMSIN